MVRQRFLVLFRRWAFTVAKVLGPVFLFEIFVLVRQHFNYAPVSILDLLAGALTSFLIVALLCLFWAWGEWWWSKLRRFRGFVSQLRQCSRNYWTPEAVKAKKA
jgi:hypothetical protein